MFRILHQAKKIHQFNEVSHGLSSIRSFRAAIVLSGCGVYDGSEITESVSLMIALSKKDADVKFFAPNRNQAHVVNHLNGEEQPESRNVMQEAARIARGEVNPLEDLKSENFDAVFIPGGFGAAKNLSSFAFEGAEMEVHEDVQKVMKDFHNSQKVVGMCCISPVIAAKVFGHKNVKLTLGCKGKNWPYEGSIDAAQSFGASMEELDIDEVCVDEQHKIVTTPAYMKGDAKPDEIFRGIEKMVEEVSKRI
uniref:DJ-1/PfpI domain-containing protein n=1 Tax=Fibrocapsa japonica TaxID=94617 RepID=A0A7S2V8H1_9STRA